MPTYPIPTNIKQAKISDVKMPINLKQMPTNLKGNADKPEANANIPEVKCRQT